MSTQPTADRTPEQNDTRSQALYEQLIADSRAAHALLDQLESTAFRSSLGLNWEVAQ